MASVFSVSTEEDLNFGDGENSEEEINFDSLLEKFTSDQEEVYKTHNSLIKENVYDFICESSECDKEENQLKQNSMVETTQEIDILLIGKTGNGKSAVGNTILGRYSFESKPSLSSITKDINFDVCKLNGLQIKVVDGPGVGDTRMDKQEAKINTLESISNAIAINPDGYHAFVLVVKYGSRFTLEDEETVSLLKEIFGEHFFNKFCIIVMTCGDEFEKENTIEFGDWVTKQDNGIFKKILTECNNRIVLFDNKTRDKAKQTKQSDELLGLIHSLRGQNSRYSNEHFSLAKISRDTLQIQCKQEFIEEEILSQANTICQRLKRVQKSVRPHKITPFLEELCEEASALHRNITAKDNGTGVLHNLVAHVWSLLCTIREEIKVSMKIAEEKKKFKTAMTNAAQKHAEELKRQKSEFQKAMTERNLQDSDRNVLMQTLVNETKEVKSRLDSFKENFDAKTNDMWTKEKEKVDIAVDNVKKLHEGQKSKINEKLKKGFFAKFLKKMGVNKKGLSESDNVLFV